MSAKISGAEFKRFFHDDQYWAPASHWDDVLLTINGKPEPDFDVDTLNDADEVKVESGDVYFNDSDKTIQVATFFKSWKKAQTESILIVDVDSANKEAVIAAIKAAGGRVR